MTDKKSEEIRSFSETGSPVVIVTRNIRKICHNEIHEQHSGGHIFQVKMRPTQPFLVQLNECVLNIFQECIKSARAEGRTELLERDLPEIISEEDYEDGDDEEF